MRFLLVAILAGYGFIPSSASEESWVHKKVMAKRPNVAFEDSSQAKTVRYEFQSTVHEVVDEKEDQLRIRSCGHEGWVDRADFILIQRALVFFSEMVSKEPKNSWAWSQRGMAWQLQGDWRHAIEDCTAAIRLDPKNAKAFCHRGAAWADKKEYEKAIADFDQALSLRPDNGWFWRNRGGIRLHQHQYNGAIADLDHAIRLNPKDSAAFVSRNYCWRSKREPEKAFADCNEAVRLNPRNADAFEARGRAKAAIAKDYDGAIRDFDEAIRLSPTQVGSYMYRGLAWRVKREFERAVEDFTMAIKLNPRLPEPFVMRGLAKIRQNDWQNAITDLDQAIRLGTQDDQCYAKRGDLRFEKKNDVSGAITDYDMAIKLNPDRWDLYLARGSAHVLRAAAAIENGQTPQRSDLETGIADLSIGIDHNSQEPVIGAHALVTRAAAWIKMGDYDKALKDYSSASLLDAEIGHVVFTNRSLLLAGCPDAKYRDGKRAIDDARKACALSQWCDPLSISNLAAAYAEFGDFEAAVRCQQKALDRLNPNKKADRVEEYQRRLKLFQQNKPYRLPPPSVK